MLSTQQFTGPAQIQAVASVDEFGVVTCHKKGRATIIAITGNGYTAKCKVKVTGKAKKKGVMYGITNVDGLFIRNSASLQGLQLGQYNCGVSVTIVDKIGEWYKIKYNGGYAYVRSAYVTITSDQRSGNVVNASNGKISTETWVYTGVGYGANTVAPVGTRVLVTGASRRLLSGTLRYRFSWKRLCTEELCNPG